MVVVSLAVLINVFDPRLIVPVPVIFPPFNVKSYVEVKLSQSVEVKNSS